MSNDKTPLGITEVVLRDAHQSLFATRMRLDDMLPIAEKLDKIGYWSLETWGGATFDSCIRFLGEDPWERIRKLKEAMPNTPQQMLFRGQNILGYRHYADDVVEKFVERAAVNGVDVFRIFDAMNDPRNLETAIKAVREVEKHAQGAISYTVSPVHTIDLWVQLARTIESMGADSVCIKDMAGLLKPYVAFELVSRLKKELSIPVHMHCHATTGLSTAAILKAVEAGVDNVDASISSMSMTYGHSSTEAIVAMLEGQHRATGLKLTALEEIAAYFRKVRKKYRHYEGSLKGTDSRILVSQVPGGMLTNMESQLREQGAADRIDEVLLEIPRVREDLGFIPLVTPTSQIVGTQAVLNVLTGERYKSISKETVGVLKGEYGATPAPMNTQLQNKVLDGEDALSCRPADRLEPELARLTDELRAQAKQKNISLAKGAKEIDDVLTYALFPQIGLRFLENRGNPSAFEPVPAGEQHAVAAQSASAQNGNIQNDNIQNDNKTVQSTGVNGPEVYTVTVNGQAYVVQVEEGGDISRIAAKSAASLAKPVSAVQAEPVKAPLAGNIFKVNVDVGGHVQQGDILIVLEAMKMETEVRAARTGMVDEVCVKEGDSVAVGDILLTIA